MPQQSLKEVEIPAELRHCFDRQKKSILITLNRVIESVMQI